MLEPEEVVSEFRKVIPDDVVVARTESGADAETSVMVVVVVEEETGGTAVVEEEDDACAADAMA